MNKVDTTRIIRQSSRDNSRPDRDYLLQQRELPFVVREYVYLRRGVTIRIIIDLLDPYPFDVWLGNYHSRELSSGGLEFFSLSCSLMYCYQKILAHGYDLDDLRLQAIRARAEEKINNAKTQKVSL